VGRVPPFICTLAMYIASSGLALIVTRSETIAALPPAFNRLGGSLLGDRIPVPAVVAVAAVAVAQVVLGATRFGRYIVAIGGNEEAAYLSGVPVRRIKILTYTFCGLMVGLASVVNTARMQAASPIFGKGEELNAIAATILGGTSLMGGEGTVVGTLFGALVIQTLRAGLAQMNIDSNWQQVVIGAILVGMVLIDQLRKGRA
jgi:ribose/xylose/arabinose/galactoside ABC-type transport system permease subunit